MCVDHSHGWLAVSTTDPSVPAAATADPTFQLSARRRFMTTVHSTSSADYFVSILQIAPRLRNERR